MENQFSSAISTLAREVKFCVEAEAEDPGENFKKYWREKAQEFQAAISTLEALAEENEKVKAGDEDILVKAKELSIEVDTAVEKAKGYKSRAEKAEAEVGRLDGAYKWLSQTNTELVEMREKAEADRDKWKAWYEERKDVAEGTRQMFNDKVAELEKVKADFDEAVKALVLQQGDMEKFRPLIEAAQGVDKRRLISLIGGSELRHALPRGGAADRQMYAIDVEAERQIHSLVEAIPERGK